MRFLTAKSHNVQSNFSYITWQQLTDKIINPPNLGKLQVKQAKNKAAIVGASDAPNKQKETVKSHNNFTLLRLDLDDTPLTVNEVKQDLLNLNLTSFAIHTTISHQGNAGVNRFRVYIQLANSIDLNDWSALETYLSYIFKADDCAMKPQQIMYLPCRLDGDSYEYFVSDGAPFQAIGSSLLKLANEFIIKQNEDLALKQQRKSNIIKSSFPEKLVGRSVSIIDAVNQSFSWEYLLTSYGYKQQANAWLPPESNSNTAGAYILTSDTDKRERYYSHHSSDPCAIGQCLDQFDFITIRSFHGDYVAALTTLAKEHFPQLDKHNKKEWAINSHNIQVSSLFQEQSS